MTVVCVVYSSADETCRHCDSRKVDMLSTSMFEAITRASLHENPPTGSEDSMAEVSPIITNQLLSTLVTLLDVGEGSSPTPAHTLAEIEGIISSFLTTIVNRKGLWGKTKSMTRSMLSHAADVDYDILRQRQVDLQRCFVDLREFQYLAVMCIRKYDKDCHYHCGTRWCGDDCPFAPYRCVNQGCLVVTSQIHSMDHDNECPWKLLPCPKGCGDYFPRREQETHLLVCQVCCAGLCCMDCSA